MKNIDDKNIRKLDGGLLLVFRELIRQGRATGAAERLGLSQSGVSHALARLREAFGDPLFIRRPHGLVPTARTLELAGGVEAMLALARGMVGGESAFDPATATRQFRVGSADFVTAILAAPLLGRLQAQAPGVGVSFVPLLGRPAFDALTRGEVDLALGRFSAPPQPLLRERLFSDRYAVVGRGSAMTSLTLEAFAAASHVLVATGPGAAAPLADAVLAELGVKRRVLATAAHFLTAFAIAAETDALVTAPRPLALRHAGRFGLAIAEAPFRSPPLEVFTVRRAGPAGDPAGDWLIEQVRAAVAATPPPSGPA